MDPSSAFAVDIPADVREHWEARFRKLEPKLNKIVDDVAGSYDNEVQACRTQAKSIAAETAALDEARYERERDAGVSGPLDPEFAEMVALRTERRQLQRQRIAEDGLVYGRLNQASSWRDLELRQGDPRLLRLGPDMGEEATDMRLAHLAQMQQQNIAHKEHSLRSYASRNEMQNHLDGCRERIDSQRWLRGLAPEHWNRRASTPVHATELAQGNIHGMQELNALKTYRGLYKGISKTEHYNDLTSDMVSHGRDTQYCLEHDDEANYVERAGMLKLEPLRKLD